MKMLLILAALVPLWGQQTIRWAATTGDVALSGSAYSATMQQPASNGQSAYVDQILVYCSAACTVTQAANGAGATATAGTVTPILPTQLSLTVPVNFWTGSNVGAGSAQGGAVHIPAGSSVVLCLTRACGAPADVSLSPGPGIKSNYTVTIAAGVTGTVNITFYGRSVS